MHTVHTVLCIDVCSVVYRDVIGIDIVILGSRVVRHWQLHPCFIVCSQNIQRRSTPYDSTTNGNMWQGCQPTFLFRVSHSKSSVLITTHTRNHSTAIGWVLPTSESCHKNFENITGHPSQSVNQSIDH